MAQKTCIFSEVSFTHVKNVPKPHGQCAQDPEEIEIWSLKVKGLATRVK